VIWGGAVLVLGLLAWRWSALLTSTLNEELAFSAGIRPERERLVLTVALAIVVALAIKVVGALLIAAMLIIPAAAARSFARTPEIMAAVAVGLGLVSVAVGLEASLVADTPAGPSIVAASAVLYALSVAAGLALRRD
jgi:zinc transport system permease protein